MLGCFFRTNISIFTSLPLSFLARALFICFFISSRCSFHRLSLRCVWLPAVTVPDLLLLRPEDRAVDLFELVPLAADTSSFGFGEPLPALSAALRSINAFFFLSYTSSRLLLLLALSALPLLFLARLRLSTFFPPFKESS